MTKYLLKFHGIVEHGQFKPENPEALKMHMQNLEGQKIFATFQKWRPYKQRSENENRYY